MSPSRRVSEGKILFSGRKSEAERKGIAVTWLFHLVGDIRQPLHTAQLFTVEDPNGDRRGNEICVRVTSPAQI